MGGGGTDWGDCGRKVSTQRKHACVGAYLQAQMCGGSAKELHHIVLTYIYRHRVGQHSTIFHQTHYYCYLTPTGVYSKFVFSAGSGPFRDKDC